MTCPFCFLFEPSRAFAAGRNGDTYLCGTHHTLAAWFQGFAARCGGL